MAAHGESVRSGDAVRVTIVSLLSILVLAGNAGRVSTAEEINWQKARELYRKSRSGESLTSEEQEYLDRAKKARKQRGRQAPAESPTQGNESTGMVPLTDMAAGDEYKGEDGGLYAGESNVPPENQLNLALEAGGKIKPLDAEGNPDPGGKIALISIGMSNTTQEFSAFMKLAANDPEMSDYVVLVDGAQGGRDAHDWSHPEERKRPDRPSPWDVLPERLEAAGVSNAQIQVAWIKHARRQPESLGEYPKHAEALAEDIDLTVGRLKELFPNLRIAYLAGRTYADYAKSTLNPEPYAYESAFAVRSVILDQINGKESLNCDPKKGPVVVPVLLWGPYLWADGAKGREVDDLVWTREDFGGDGTHLTEQGRKKVAELLLGFFKTDPTAKGWFAAENTDESNSISK